MHIARVGTATLLAIMMAWVMPAASVPSEDYSEGFRHGGIGDWDLVQGALSMADNETTRPRMAHPTVENSYLILEDDGSAGRSRTRLNATTIDDDRTDYTVEVIMQRDSEYIAPGETAFDPLGWIAVTFGEANGTGAFHAAVFLDDTFALANYTSTDASATVIHSQSGWGAVPPRYDHQTPLPATIDEAHRYTIDVRDGVNVTVSVDGWQVNEQTLPGSAVGTIGVLARDSTKVWIQQVVYRALDDVAPGVLLHRPEAGRQYVLDVTVETADLGIIPVVGDLTVEADIFDTGGIRTALLALDGRSVPGGLRTDLPDGVHQWLIQTHELEFGTHVITLTVEDYAGNRATDSVAIYVIPTVAETSPVSDTLRELF